MTDKSARLTTNMTDEYAQLIMEITHECDLLLMNMTAAYERLTMKMPDEYVQFTRAESPVKLEVKKKKRQTILKTKSTLLARARHEVPQAGKRTEEIRVKAATEINRDEKFCLPLCLNKKADEAVA